MSIAEQRARSALTDRFSDSLAAVAGHAHRVADPTAARERVAEIVGGRTVVVDGDPLLREAAEGLPRATDPWQAEVGITTAVTACAETGTLGLAFEQQHARSTSLVPPCHVAVVPACRIVETYVELIDRMAEISPVPSGIQLITGPSGSADIEMIHIQGMHGPTTVHVVLVAQSAS